MIQPFIDRFQEIKEDLLKDFSKEQPSSYSDILTKTLTKMFSDENGEPEYGKPDFNNIHVIDDGDYQGTLVFIIPKNGYQPSDYWCVKVDYGSCSGCDTYEAYAEWNEEDYYKSAPHMVTMAMHMIQSMKDI